MLFLVIDVEVAPCCCEHYTGRLTWRGQSALNSIRSKFEELQLLERARVCPFKQFFKAPALRFPGIIMHQLLLKKIKSSNRNEIHFTVNGRPVKFGIGEYALITGLNFESYLKRCLTAQSFSPHTSTTTT